MRPLLKKNICEYGIHNFNFKVTTVLMLKFHITILICIHGFPFSKQTYKCYYEVHQKRRLQLAISQPLLTDMIRVNIKGGAMQA